MGIICEPKRVKLFCGIILSEEKIKQGFLGTLEKKFGKVDLISDTAIFNFSDYYNSEMGHDLKRFWISFEKLISADELAEIKVFTNHIENVFALNNKRVINIDPGYVTPANVVLATTKNYAHRIYLASGIYAEVTIVYKKNGFLKLPWSYPDYLSKPATAFFLSTRSELLKQLKKDNND
ncbi:MAG: DUF4416 family protein [Endomicrobium sp.]|jgi:hypothetical protein|nr:DUF4416 family protein [Endomicrobium sp.]